MQLDTITCPHCKNDVQAEYNFCVLCDKQIRCLDAACNKLLVSGKSFCLSCGNSLKRIDTTTNATNRYVRDIIQKGNNFEEHVEFIVSDYAVGELAPFIVGQINSAPSIRTQPLTNRAQSQSFMPQMITPSQPNPGSDLVRAENEDETASVATPMPETSMVNRFFVVDEDILIATEKDFKGDTWASQQKNFIVLFASAYFTSFNKPVPTKDKFKIAAEKTGVYDHSNFAKYFKKCENQFLTLTSEGYILNQPGEKEFNKITTLMLDTNSQSGFAYWLRQTSSNTKHFRMSKEDMNRIKSWAEEDVQLGELNVKDLKSARDYALVAFWIIIDYLKKSQAIRWNEAFHYFKEKYKAISVTPDGFSSIIRSDNERKYFRQSEERYFLTSEAVELVNSWIGGQPISSSKK